MKIGNLKAKVHELHGMYTVRMIAAVMLIQMTTCVLALAFSILVLRQSTREIRENEQSTLEVYGNLADVNLKRAQAQINSFAFDSLEVAVLNSHPDGTEKDYYRAISHVAKLSYDMGNLVTSNPWVGAFYCYFRLFWHHRGSEMPFSLVIKPLSEVKTSGSEVECGYLSISDTPYPSCSGCSGIHMPFG